MRCSNGPVPTKQLLAAAATAGGDRLERDRSLELRHGLPLRPGRYHDTGCVEHLNLKKKEQNLQESLSWRNAKLERTENIEKDSHEVRFAQGRVR